jgi:hypothetical protein
VLLRSVCEGYGIAIDRWHQRTPDKAKHDGHYYSDKAPGTAALALPAFAAAAGVLKLAGVDLDSPTGWRVTSWAACAFSQALPAALGAPALFVWLGRFVSQRAALVAVLALTLGGLPLPYSTLLFSHAQVIGLIGIAVWAVGMFQEVRREKAEDRSQKSEVRIGSKRMGLAGFCLGLALASEYTAGIVVVALGAYVVVREWRRCEKSEVGSQKLEGMRGATEAREEEEREARSQKSEAGPGSTESRPTEGGSGMQETRSRVSVMGSRSVAGETPALPTPRRSLVIPRPLLWFFLAAVPPLLLIPAYSWATLGTPFQLPYSYQASFPEMKEGLYAIKWPNLEILGRLLIGPMRGLVFWTPFLVMAGFGWWWMAQERPRWLWLTYAVPVFHALVISGRVWDWQAGYTLSARYMAPILPLLALPCAIGTQRWPKLGLALAAVSIGLMTLATVTDACPDYTIYNPLTELHLPKLMKGEFSYTLGTEVLGLPPWVSVALYYAILAGGIAWLWRLTGRSEAAAGTPGPTGVTP